MRAGDVIILGRYPQRADPSAVPEPVEWLVLAADGETAVLISRHALAAKAFEEHVAGWMAWEACSLRRWLNGEFLQAVFSEEERARLKTVTVTAEFTDYADVSPGGDTRDRVFLLDLDETLRYFPAREARICFPTERAAAEGAYAAKENGAASWWLRSPGALNNYGMTVDGDGSIDTDGVWYEGGGMPGRRPAVRPAVVLSIV